MAFTIKSCLVLFCICLLFVSASGLTQFMIDSDYIALNYNATFNLNGAPYASSNQTLVFNNLDLSGLSEVTFEIYFYWRGYSIGNGKPWQPLFYYGDANNFILITPRGNTESFGSLAIPYIAIKTASTVLQTQDFEGYADNQWNYIAVGLRPSGAGPSYAFISSFPSSAFVDGAPEEFSASAVPSNMPPGIGYMGQVPTDHQAGASITSPYSGRVDEFRIWNTFIDKDAIKQKRMISLEGNEPNLFAYYRFDEGSGNLIRDSAGNHDGFVPSILNPETVQRRKQTDPATSGLSVAPDRFTPIFQITRTTPFNVPIAFDTANNADVSNQNYSIEATTPLVHSVVCFGGVCTTGVVESLPAPGFNRLAVTVTPQRGACGRTETGVFSLMELTDSSNEFTITLTVPPINPILSAANTLIPTTGGRVTWTGTNLGLPGLIDDNESLRVTLESGAILTCNNPTVNAGGTSVRCDFNEGVGTGTLGGTLCNKILVASGKFGYLPPSVVSVIGLNTTELYISGDNFGPQRPFDGVYDNIVLFDLINDDVITCLTDVVVSGHINITCTTDKVVNVQQYMLGLSIGGQQLNYTFDFQICNPPCLNGGLCTGVNFCDCSRTGYEGEICENKLNCLPECKNNGTCVKSTETGKLTCDCAQGWTGNDCGQSTDQKSGGKGLPIPLIAGVVGGGGGTILILSGIVVFLLIRRAMQPKRGGVTFIPLEKKDFTKIIWGEQLNQNPEKTSGNTKQLEELLVEDNLELAATISKITQITEADKIAKAMVVIFQDNDKVLHLLQAFIGEEVNTTESAGTLFRSNSMVSKMFKFYSRLIGLPYLYETIGPEINEIIEDELGLEVDPEKMEEGTDLDEMRWTLMAQSQKILKSVLNSVDKCPPQFRVLFSHIKKCVAERFPGSVNTTIGGFIFLRFFCPAVSSPEAYGIVEEPPSAQARRLLILITKVLQNLSNDVEFGSKEPYMTKMNDFIQSNRAKLEQFYEKLVKPSSKPPVVCDMPKNMKAISLAVLSNHIRDNLNKVEDPSLKAKLESIV